MKTTIEAFIYHVDFGGICKPSYTTFSSDNMGDKFYTLVGRVDIEYEIPDQFNPIAAKVAALQKAQAAAQKEHARTMAIFEEQISKLQCLEMAA